MLDVLPPEYIDWLYSGGISLNYDVNDLMIREVGAKVRETV